jgi:hypothetical protein
VEIEHIVQTKYGGLKVAELVGKKFGTKVSSVYFVKPLVFEFGDF